MTSVSEWGGKPFYNLRLHSVTHSCLQSSHDVTMNRSRFMCPCWILRCTDGWCHRDNMSGGVLADAVCVPRETTSQLWLILNLHHNFYTLNQNSHFINLTHEDEGDVMKVTPFKHNYKVKSQKDSDFFMMINQKADSVFCWSASIRGEVQVLV